MGDISKKAAEDIAKANHSFASFGIRIDFQISGGVDFPDLLVILDGPTSQSRRSTLRILPTVHTQ